MERRETSYTVSGNVNWCSTTIWRFHKKTKNRAAIWYCYPTPGHVSTEKHGLKGYTHPSVYCSTVHNSKDKKATWMTNDRELDKDVVHIYNGILFSH